MEVNIFTFLHKLEGMVERTQVCDNHTADQFNEQAAFFKALAHPVRLQILAILQEHEACVCQLEVLLRRRQAYVSQQLRVLKEAGLLQERRDGLFIFYSLARPELVQLPALIRQWAQPDRPAPEAGSIGEVQSNGNR
jgi:DNA-binding transcriptional ArsR family regulator